MKANHFHIYLPCFHPEFNFIERYWGMAKRYARTNCNYSWAELQRIVPIALAHVSIKTIRKLSEHCFRYMEAYRNDQLTPQQIEWAIQKYSSHRRVKESNIEHEFLSQEFWEENPLPNNLKVGNNIEH